MLLYEKKMISYIKVVNFRSIVEDVLHFTFDEGKSPNGERLGDRVVFCEDRLAKCRCVPVQAIFGPNAAGKTNFLRAIVNLWDVAGGARFPDVRNLYSPNLICKCNDLTSFEVEYIGDGRKYQYKVSYSNKGIQSEMLAVNEVLAYSINGGNVSFGPVVKLTSVYTKELFQERFTGECSNGNGVVVRSFLGFFYRNFSAVSKEITDAFNLLIGNTRVIGLERDHILPKAVDQLCRVANITEKEALERIVDVVRRLDVDIQSIDMKKEKVDYKAPRYRPLMEAGFQIPTVVYSIRSHHVDTEGRDVVFDFEELESAGTVHLAALVGYLLCAIETGATCFMDELEMSLHPLLVRELLNLFLRKDMNPKGAQLIFTTQMTDIMDDEILRLSEVAIVNKNRHLGSKIRRLIDLKIGGEDIRNVTNFRKRYLEGHYSGVPHSAL